MTPKEKADELVYKFMHAECQYGFINSNKHRSKQCALIAVDYVIKVFWHTHKNEMEYRFWKEVKIEIENL